MSCPDWQSLCAWRADETSEAPPGWQAALEHLDGCSSCQADALDADPILLFRRLPGLEAEAGEVEAMQRAVASMRRNQSIERRRLHLRRSWLRAAALGAILLGSLLLRGLVSPSESELAGGEDADAAPQLVAVSEEALAPVAVEEELSPASVLPLVENIDPAYGQIIQVVDQEISLVVVMPQSHDV